MTVIAKCSDYVRNIHLAAPSSLVFMTDSDMIVPHKSDFLKINIFVLRASSIEK